VERKIKMFSKREKREVNYTRYSAAVLERFCLNISADGDYIIKKKINGYGGICAQR
jgi:hypothetical protein